MNKDSETVDMMKVIIRQKSLILCSILLSVLLAFVFSFFAKRIYQVDSIIEIGSFSDINGSPVLIESADQLLEKINKGQYHCILAGSLLNSNGESCNVKAQKLEGTNLIQIEAVSSSPETYVTIIEKIGKSILEDHNNRLELRMNVLKENIITMDKEINILKGKAIYGIYIDDAIAQLLIELSRRKDQLSVFAPTIIAKAAAISFSNVNFSIYLTILFAIFIGIFIGLFAALCREWWAHHSTELKI